MNKYHTGYYLTSDDESLTAETISDQFIEEPYLKLIPSNYCGDGWTIEWIFNNHMKGLEFIIDAETFEIAQNVLCNVFCAAAVIDGTSRGENGVHYPHKYGTLNQVQGLNLILKPKDKFCSCTVPSYFYLAKLASNDLKLSNAIVKYKLSTEIYSEHIEDLDGVIEWKKTNYNYIQMKFAYAIITAYSVIEELGLGVRASTENPSTLENGEWNPKVLNDLIKRLENSKINLEQHIYWMIRGEQTKIEENKPIKTTLRADSHEDSDPSLMRNKDSYVYIPEAINYICYLRNNISSHCVGERIMELSLFDVKNAQFLAQRLLLEKVGIWK